MKINIDFKPENQELSKINELCKEWKISISDLIIYFLEHLTVDKAEEIIDKMDLCGIRKLFGIED